jgi:hypothetical protein
MEPAVLPEIAHIRAGNHIAHLIRWSECAMPCKQRLRDRIARISVSHHASGGMIGRWRHVLQYQSKTHVPGAAQWE